MNTIVAVPFDNALAEFIGKKGSENSITFYNRKLNEHVIVALMPSSIEEKFYAMPQSMLIADQIILSTKTIDKFFGEALVACSLLDKRIIFTKDNEINQFLNNIKINDFIFNSNEEILDSITTYTIKENQDSKVRVDIDKAFNVKGVGVVALGFVTKGTLKVHDTLFNNSGKEVIVRSIQSQDVDIKEAQRGTRVGLALKGITEEDLSKGDILSSTTIKTTKSIELEAKSSKFVNEPIEKGKAYFVAIGFSYVNAIIENVDNNKIKLNLDKAIQVEVNDQFMLVRAMSPRIFASGKISAVY